MLETLLLPEQFFPILLIASVLWIILEYLSIVRRTFNIVLSFVLAFVIILFFTQSITIVTSIFTLLGTNGTMILIPLLFIFGLIMGFRRRGRKYYTSAGPSELTNLERQKENLLSQLQRVKGDEKKEKSIVEAIDRLDKQILSLRKRLR